MVKSFCCQHCGKTVQLNPRLKCEQRYCSDRECQKERIRNWKRSKYATDPAYQEKRKEQQEAWRKSHHSDQYQKRYRNNNPAYVSRNRSQQKARNEKRKEKIASAVIKQSSLVLQARDDGSQSVSVVNIDLMINRHALTALTG